MKTTVVSETPIFILESGSYNGSAPDVEISVRMVKKMKIGEEIVNDQTFNCGRGCYSESIKKVFEDKTGCAVVNTTWGTTNSDNPVDWSNQELIWVTYLR